MTESQCLELAEKYLLLNKIGHLKPGWVERRDRDRWEAVFSVPETVDPSIAVVDPPDVRLWVGIHEGFVEFIPQM